MKLLIETVTSRAPPSRAPYGARGLKPFYPNLMNAPGGRAPYGARGLKRWRRERGVRRDKAAPRTGRVG